MGVLDGVLPMREMSGGYDEKQCWLGKIDVLAWSVYAFIACSVGFEMPQTEGGYYHFFVSH